MPHALSLDDTIQKCLSELNANPASKAFAQLSEAYRKQGRLGEAIEVAREGLKHHPRFVLGKIALAQATYDNGDDQEAAMLLEDVLRLSQDNLIAMKILSQIYFDRGDCSKGVPLLKKVTVMDPADETALKQLSELENLSQGHGLKTKTLAAMYQEQGHVEEAAAIYGDLGETSAHAADHPARVFLEALLVQIKQRRRAS